MVKKKVFTKEPAVVKEESKKDLKANKNKVAYKMKKVGTDAVGNPIWAVSDEVLRTYE